MISKRRAPATALGLDTARFGDWARLFPGHDRMSHMVPSPTVGPSTDSRRSNGLGRLPSQGNVLNTATTPERNNKDNF